jgi:hypothetical protein
MSEDGIRLAAVQLAADVRTPPQLNKKHRQIDGNVHDHNCMAAVRHRRLDEAAVGTKHGGEDGNGHVAQDADDC